MSFYDQTSSWSAPARQPSWEQQQQHQQQSQPPSRSASASAAPTSSPGESTAFALQFEEIDRATDNLIKSGKWYPTSAASSAASHAAPMSSATSSASSSRRESMPAIHHRAPHDYNAAEQRHGPAQQRHGSVSDFSDAARRPDSAGLQNYYAGQRFPSGGNGGGGGGKQSEAEQVLQAKRRMAAQRERELRNYHQEQQYNRTVSGVKTDRALSPTTMTEDDRRELIARQHRALYGDSASLYTAPDGSRSHSQDARAPSGRGASPLAFDPFGQGQSGNDGTVQMPPRGDRAENAASPVSGAPAQPPFALMGDARQSSRTSSASPAGSPPLIQGQKEGLSGVGPIGSRGMPGPSGLGKRSTTPLTPSALSYGYNASDGANAHHGKDERSASAASNPQMADKGVGGLASWGSNSGVWGSSKNSLGVQPAVWG